MRRVGLDSFSSDRRGDQTEGIVPTKQAIFSKTRASTPMWQVYLWGVYFWVLRAANAPHPPHFSYPKIPKMGIAAFLLGILHYLLDTFRLTCEHWKCASWLRHAAQAVHF